MSGKSTTSPATASTGDERDGVSNGKERYRVPSTKRARTFQRQVEKAKKAIQSGEIEPKCRPVSDHCQCAYRTAQSILSKLTDSGVIERHGRGWKRAG